MISHNILNKWCDSCAILECVMGQHTETACVFDIMTYHVVSKSGFCHDQSVLSIPQATYRLCVVIKKPELYGWKSFSLPS